MKHIKWPTVFLLINLGIVSGVIISFLNLLYPMVGHDYAFVIPQMLDSHLHFLINGLGIQWYTPSFGGGLPAFPNPNNVQFSLLGVLPAVIPPWHAVILSNTVYIFFGGIACYYLLNRMLKFHWTSCILGVVFFLANGFIMQRVAIGHHGYQTFPLIVLLVIVLINPSLPWCIAGLLFALVVGLLIHQAGYFLIIIFGLSLLMTVPLVYIYRPEIISWKHLIRVAVLGGTIALLISASKLAAVYSFMRFFPRLIVDSYSINPIVGLWGIFSQLLGTMNLVPLFVATGLDPNLLNAYMFAVTGAQYGFSETMVPILNGYWEFDMSLSPFVFGLLIFGVYTILRSPGKYRKLFTSNKKWLAWAAFILSTWLTVEFILARGLMYPYLRQLPILSSLHVNPRFAAAFLFPLAFFAAAIYNRWAAKWRNHYSVKVFLLFNLLTLAPLSTYFMVHEDLQYRNYNITESFKIHEAINAGNMFPITSVKIENDSTQALSRQISNLRPYEPIFGYELENYHPEIKEGSIWSISDGYYNMTNPAGYVFPEVNNTHPFERIRVEDKDKLKAFATRHQPDWKIPLYQQVLDWVSGLTFLITLVVLLVYGIIRSRGRFRTEPSSKRMGQ